MPSNGAAQADNDYAKLAARAKLLTYLPYALTLLVLAAIHGYGWAVASGKLEQTLDGPAAEAVRRVEANPPSVLGLRLGVRTQLAAFTLAVTAGLALLILIFPSMHGIRINRARDQLRRWAAAPKDQASFHGFVASERNKLYLEEEARRRIWQRFGFALLITLMARQVALPEGLDDFLIGEFMANAAMPGESRGPFFLTSISQAEPLIFGLAGYLLYALTLHVRRLALGDLSHRMLTPLFIRGLTVVLLGVVVAGTLTGETAEAVAKALLFGVGVFPESGFSYLSKLAQSGLERLSGESDNSLRTIREIDIWKATALEETGILNVSDLAKADGQHLLLTQGMNGAVLLRSLDRAVLLDTFGDKLAGELERVPVYGATELLLYCLGRDAYKERWRGLHARCELGEELSHEEKERRHRHVCELLGVSDIRLLLQQLANDRNVWLTLDNKLGWGTF